MSDEVRFNAIKRVLRTEYRDSVYRGVLEALNAWPPNPSVSDELMASDATERVYDNMAKLLLDSMKQPNPIPGGFLAVWSEIMEEAEAAEEMPLPTLAGLQARARFIQASRNLRPYIDWKNHDEI